ncbi:MAG: hypothetical protein EX263_09210 [Flavobacteriaceae bacterium]|nr:hypothetical protein [Flavobacteriaceae bacterium]NNL31698.1 hypothetical protein [Flavobacteriaceae bacterium]RZW46554.1 MAG: hypothetical protein EX263_09210 [Flavobacteriaceae bacterium]
MSIKELVGLWFSKWETGDFMNLPISDDFKHTSPYGTISGKQNYLDLVTENKDKFLGHKFEISDALYNNSKACIQYKAVQPDFELEVTEWHYVKKNKINRIIAYYNIDEKRITIDS